MKKFKDLFEAPGDLKKGDPSVNYSLQQGRKEPDDDQSTKYKPRSKGEQDFYNMHNVQKVGHPVARDSQFSGEIEGDPMDHVGGKTPEPGERTPVKQGSSDEKAQGREFKNPKQYKRTGDQTPVMQGSSKIKESIELSEGVVDSLKDIVKTRGAKEVKFKNNRTLKVDMQTANLLLKVHDSLKPANASKFRNALEKGPDSFMKMLDFANSVTG